MVFATAVVVHVVGSLPTTLMTTTAFLMKLGVADAVSHALFLWFYWPPPEKVVHVE